MLFVLEFFFDKRAISLSNPEDIKLFTLKLIFEIVSLSSILLFILINAFPSKIFEKFFIERKTEEINISLILTKKLDISIFKELISDLFSFFLVFKALMKVFSIIGSQFEDI